MTQALGLPLCIYRSKKGHSADAACAHFYFTQHRKNRATLSCKTRKASHKVWKDNINGINVFRKQHTFAAVEAFASELLRIIYGKDAPEGGLDEYKSGHPKQFVIEEISGLTDMATIFALQKKDPKELSATEKKRLQILDINDQTYDWDNLARELVAHLYTLNDDVTPTNLGVGSDNKFHPFDSDMRFWSAMLTWGVSNANPIATRRVVIFPQNYFPTDPYAFAANIYESPDLNFRKNGFWPTGFWPTILQRGTGKNRWTQEKIKWFRQLNSIPSFNRAKYKYFLKCLLIDSDMIQAIVDFCFAHDADVKRKVFNGFSCYQKTYCSTLLEHSPEFRLHILLYFNDYKKDLLDEFEQYKQSLPTKFSQCFGNGQKILINTKISELLTREILETKLDRIKEQCDRFYRAEVLQKISDGQNAICQFFEAYGDNHCAEALLKSFQKLEIAAKSHDEEKVILSFNLLYKAYAASPKQVQLLINMEAINKALLTTYSPRFLVSNDLLQKWLGDSRRHLRFDFGMDSNTIRKLNAYLAKPLTPRSLQKKLERLGLKLSYEQVQRLNGTSSKMHFPLKFIRHWQRKLFPPSRATQISASQ